MSYNTKTLLTDINNKPIAQYYNPKTDTMEPIEGSYGANRFIERGRIIRDSFTGSSTVTKSYSSNMYGFSIVNDGESDLIVTINTFDIVVRPNESFDDLFDPFTSITITGDSEFRAVVRE